MTGSQSTRRSADKIDPEQLTIVPLRHPWRWVAVALVLVSVAGMIRSAISNPEFQWPIVAQYLFNPLILDGLWQTVLITAVVMALATLGEPSPH